MSGAVLKFEPICLDNLLNKTSTKVLNFISADRKNFKKKKNKKNETLENVATITHS